MLAIVESVVDIKQLSKRIAAAHIALQDADRVVDRVDAQAAGARAEQGRRRLELGEMLVEARKQWPARGPNAKGWGEMLAIVGIEERTARNYMALSGYQEVSETDSRVSENARPPTYAEAGIDKRPRKSDDRPSPPKQATPSTASRSQGPAEPLVYRNDIDRALLTLNKTVIGYARAWPQKSRKQLARSLRDAATAIESMTDEET